MSNQKPMIELQRRADEAYAMALGNGFLLHYLLKRLEAADLRDKNGNPFNVNLVFQQALQALTEEGSGRDPDEAARWEAAMIQIKRLEKDWLLSD